ncbi:MAG: DUF433 domain-containing protein [Chloroflexia bacterium]
MAQADTGYEHIALDENGVPVIAGTTPKVIELVVERQAYGWSPEELYFQHPYLSLGQIYSALAYYSDHTAELDQDIQRRLTEIDWLRRQAGPSPLKEKPGSKS